MEQFERLPRSPLVDRAVARMNAFLDVCESADVAVDSTSWDGFLEFEALHQA